MPTRALSHSERERARLGRPSERHYNQMRGADRQWYSTERWKRVRKKKLRRDPLCAVCGEAEV